MEQKNIEVQRKKGLNLMMKILITAIIPLLILVTFAGLAIRAVGVSVSDKLMQHELKTSIYAVNQTLSVISSGDWNVDGDQLYKGDYNISEHQDVLDAFKENTGLDVTLSWNTTRMATSLVRQDGSRETGTEIAADVYQTVKEKGSYFVSDNVIDGQKYYGYYEGLYNSDGSMAGLVFTGMASTSVHEIYNDRLKKNIIFMVVLAIFACIFLAIVMMKIVKAMMSMIDHLDDVAEGNLDSKISDRMTSRSDEIGNIARALYSLIGGLAMIVKNIRTSAKSLDDFSARFQNSFTTINESIHNVNTAMEDIANGATNQAGEMQKVNEQISDMNEAIAETTKNVENLTGSTEEMKEQNHKLDGTIKDLVEISDRTRESVDEVNRQTDRTNQSVMEIGSAIQMITDIASQTNLLSLNASIEAARAGEHGKGFAVVADEIRQLADQSSDSAKKIGDIVEELIKNSNKSVETMNGVLDEINEQNEKLSTTREAFDGLNTEVGNVVVAIDNIRREIETVNTAKNDVMSSMESLAAIAQENAASTEETSASMTELSGIVTDCNAHTLYFDVTKGKWTFRNSLYNGAGYNGWKAHDNPFLVRPKKENFI